MGIHAVGWQDMTIPNAVMDIFNIIRSCAFIARSSVPGLDLHARVRQSRLVTYRLSMRSRCHT